LGVGGLVSMAHHIRRIQLLPPYQTVYPMPGNFKPAPCPSRATLGGFMEVNLIGTQELN